MTRTWKFFRGVHLAASALFSLFAAAVGLSGSALVFREEIEAAIYEPRIRPGSTLVPLDTLLVTAATIERERRVALVVMPKEADQTVEFVLQKREARTLKDADQMSVYLNQYTGRIEGSRRRQASPIAWLRDLHFAFFSGPPGLTFNGYVAFALVLLSLTGLVLWIVTSPENQRFRLSLRGGWKSVLWNLHRQAGLLSLTLLILVSLTGACYAFRDRFLEAIQVVAGPLPPRGAPSLVPPPNGAAPRSLDDICAAARAAAPGPRLAILRIPAQKAQAWPVTLHRAGDSGESLDSGPTVFIDPYTLKALRFDDPATMPLGGRLVKWMEPVHYGKFGGLPVKILWALLGLMPLLFASSGAIMWWNRTGGGRPARRMTSK
jgi:uncharacterized iron-regulated membrane protein